MELLIIIIIIFIFYNLQNTLEPFTFIKEIKKNKKYIELIFNKNDTFKPNDELTYKLFIKEEISISETEKEYIKNKNFKEIKNWKEEEIDCNNNQCIFTIDDPNKTYYFFIKKFLNGKGGKIDKIYTIYGNLDIPVYSPNVLQIIKENNKMELIFKKSNKDSSIPKPPFKYEIYYKKESEIVGLLNSPSYISPTPSYITPTPSYISTTMSINDKISIWKKLIYIYQNFNFTDKNLWNKKTQLCNQLMCKCSINDLEDEPYHIFILELKNGKKSTINNIIRVSNEQPFKTINFGIEETEKILKNDVKCSDYNIKNCPDELTGTILSKCYKDKEYKICKKSIEKNYIF